MSTNNTNTIRVKWDSKCPQDIVLPPSASACWMLQGCVQPEHRRQTNSNTRTGRLLLCARCGKQLAYDPGGARVQPVNPRIKVTSDLQWGPTPSRRSAMEMLAAMNMPNLMAASRPSLISSSRDRDLRKISRKFGMPIPRHSLTAQQQTRA